MGHEEPDVPDHRDVPDDAAPARDIPADAVSPHAEGTIVHLHVHPGAGRDAVTGRYGDAVRVRVRARAVDGRANEAVLDLLAGVLGVARHDVDLLAGPRSRTKRCLIRGVAPADVLARLRGAP